MNVLLIFRFPVVCRLWVLCVYGVAGGWLLSLTGGAAQAQTVRYVSATSTSTNPATATTWATATADLQGAINASAAGEQVWVKGGLYKPGGPANTDRSISFAMKAGVAIYGGFAGGETLLSQRPGVNPVAGAGRTAQPSSSTLSGNLGAAGTVADNSYHVINNPAGLTTTAVLDGFVITGGNANGDALDNNGGGIINNASGSGNVCNPLILNCLFQNNSANVSGGAVYNYGSRSGVSSPILTNCAFQGNSADEGGGIYNNGYDTGTSSPRLTNCTFQTNTATYGGAMFNYGDGGGNSSPVLTNCAFQTNSVTSGGGAMCSTSNRGTSSPSLTNCSFQGNTATSGANGGAIYNDGSSTSSAVTLTNCSFQNNTATGTGGAIYNSGYRSSLTNCVVFNNGGFKALTNRSSSSVSATHSLFDDSVTGYTGTANRTTSVSPFANASDTGLAAGSPAINAGNNAAYDAVSGPAIDLFGNARVVGGTIDMGAYEFQGSLPVTLRYFSGRMTDAGALLGWATARETDNAFFQIERSRNAVAGAGLAFESIATIPTQAVDGNSITELTYNYSDPHPLPGINYYRLVQTDRDGTRTTHTIIALTRDGAAPVLFPNPVSAAGEVSIEPAISHTGYQIVDVLGRVVQRVDGPGLLGRVSLAGLPAGVYVLHVQTADGGTRTWRMLR